VKYLVPLLFCLLCLAGCGASLMGLGERIGTSGSKVTQGSVPVQTTDKPSLSKPTPQSAHAAEPIEASFAGTANLDRF